MRIFLNFMKSVRHKNFFLKIALLSEFFFRNGEIRGRRRLLVVQNQNINVIFEKKVLGVIF